MSLPESLPREPICLITGSTRGLGRAVAESMARRGGLVIVSGRDAGAAVRVATEIGVFGASVALSGTLDVAQRDNVDRAASWVRDRFGKLDVLINNAAVMETNLYGAWNMIQAFLPLLELSEHPRIVNVGSGGGSHGDTRFGLSTRHGAAASYGVSKAALHALTARFAAELARTPVLVNAVDPDLTATWPGAESMGARPIIDSVPGIIWAATLPDDGPRGGFFRDGRTHPW